MVFNHYNSVHDLVQTGSSKLLFVEPSDVLFKILALRKPML